MKRRSFLQWFLGIFGIGAAGVPGVKSERYIKYVKTTETKGNPTEPVWPCKPESLEKIARIIEDNKPNCDPVFETHSCIFCGYKITAQKNVIFWHNLIEPTRIDVLQMERLLNGIELDTNDFCRALINSKDCVIWLGQRGVWKIEYVGGDRLFQFVYLGKRVQIDRRQIFNGEITLYGYMTE